LTNENDCLTKQNGRLNGQYNTLWSDFQTLTKERDELVAKVKSLEAEAGSDSPNNLKANSDEATHILLDVFKRIPKISGVPDSPNDLSAEKAAEIAKHLENLIKKAKEGVNFPLRNLSPHRCP
jgi:hypothetical protein